MKKEGLIIAPEFTNIEKYLQSGERTEATEEIRRVSQSINGKTEGMIIRNLLVWMHKNTIRLHDGNDSRKFKRTASEILVSGERTGCCDSSTLFTALARSKGIPSMQIITLSKEWGRNIDNGEKTRTSGHYFTACYLKDVSGKADWVIVDSDRKVLDARDVKLEKFDKENRNIGKNLYAFAYVGDYSEITFNGLKIDCIENMNKIQMYAYELCDKKDFMKEKEFER